MHEDMTLMVIILTGFVLIIFTLSIFFGPWAFLLFGAPVISILASEYRMRQNEKYRSGIMLDDQPINSKNSRSIDWEKHEPEV